MEVREITAGEYSQLVGTKCNVFCREAFLELNKGKVDVVRYFVGRDSKNRIAFAVGEKDGEWRSPFSAPFATIIGLRKGTAIEYYWEFVKLLNEVAFENGIKSISIFLPPDIYGSQENAKIINALLGNGYGMEYQELNYSLPLMGLDLENYKVDIQHNARKNLAIALKSGLELVPCTDLERKKEAYEVIRINRESKGYPLRMTLEQVLETIAVVKHDMFLVKKDERSIAAALVYHVTEEIVQVVYWGDVPDVGEYKPINFLSYELIKYYQERNLRHLDIGPSTENGVPNFGLCSFKESIGCEVSAKYRLTKHFC